MAYNIKIPVDFGGDLRAAYHYGYNIGWAVGQNDLNQAKQFREACDKYFIQKINMIELNTNTICEIFNCAEASAIIYRSAINTALTNYEINTPARIAAFAAQVGHESDSLKYAREIWGPTADQQHYEPPSRLAIHLGNTELGDGHRFLGRGLIQITGRANYKKIGDALGVDFVNQSELLEHPHYAAVSAGWFWQTRVCNELADADDFVGLTKRINGGLNGYDDRYKRWKNAKAFLNSTSIMAD